MVTLAPPTILTLGIIEPPWLVIDVGHSQSYRLGICILSGSGGAQSFPLKGVTMSSISEAAAAGPVSSVRRGGAIEAWLEALPDDEAAAARQLLADSGWTSTQVYDVFKHNGLKVSCRWFMAWRREHYGDR